MLANIRLRDGTISRSLPAFDLMRFSEGQVRQRMQERGYHDDQFRVCGILDWGVDTEMDLATAYALKRAIVELYDGDEMVIVHLLKKHVPPLAILRCHYVFVSKDEGEVLGKLLQQDGKVANLLQPYLDNMECLNTPKGFYTLKAVL